MAGLGVLGADITEPYNKIALACHNSELLLSCCFLGSGCRGVAGSAYAADHCILVGEDLETRETEITSLDLLVETEVGDVNCNVVRKVLHETCDADRTGVLGELTAELNALGVACDLNGNADADGLVLAYGKEVYMEADVLYRVELKFVEDGCVLFTIEVEVNDVGIRGVGKTLEILGVDCEEDVLNTCTIEVARDETLTTESLDGGFVANLTKLALKFEMLHFLNV